MFLVSSCHPEASFLFLDIEDGVPLALLSQYNIAVIVASYRSNQSLYALELPLLSLAYFYFFQNYILVVSGCGFQIFLICQL